MPCWITLRYNGNCAECDSLLREGDRAVMHEGHIYCAEDCGPEVFGGDDPGED